MALQKRAESSDLRSAVAIAGCLTLAVLFLRPLPVGPGEDEQLALIARERQSIIARVIPPEIKAYSAPSDQAPVIATFQQRDPAGTPQVFLLERLPGQKSLAIKGYSGKWYKALLPVRPNGTKGYLKAEEVVLQTTPYHLELSRKTFTLRLWKDERLVRKFTVGIGTGDTPTPTGRYYLSALLKPPDPSGIYGTYAYALSGYSEVLTDWVGGGVIGLHGTNDPSSIGHTFSHGCIRMLNGDIEKLVAILPLGTPIKIT